MPTDDPEIVDESDECHHGVPFCDECEDCEDEDDAEFSALDVRGYELYRPNRRRRMDYLRRASSPSPDSIPLGRKV